MLRDGEFVLVLFVLLVALASCAEEEYPASLWYAQHPNSVASEKSSDASALDPGGPQTCVQAQSTPLPARLVAISASAASTGPAEIIVDQVFAGFIQNCGECHGPTAETGGFQIANASAFKANFTQADLNHAKSNGPTNPSMPQVPTDPNDPMPPFNSGGMAFDKRSPSDPVVQFVDLAQAWIDAGSPESFTPSGGQDAGTDAGSVNQFALKPDVGDAMTNLGACIPSPGLVGAEQTKSAQLDAMFAALKPTPSGTPAQMIGFPEHLGETDMFTFDTRTLAQYGVVAYAPGYPLWSDNAGKLRYVRVPRGTSIQFDKATQSFKIPPNTRFYKTFMKQIVDTDGSIRWRKIETRLIVSRPDTPGVSGYSAPTALFGTYVWNADESDAVLLETPLRSGAPWVDTVIQYNTDEQLAADILSGQPLDPEQALLQGNAARHYALPGSERCIQCHMGSASESFVLGFLPLQINRRPTGVGGVIESTGPDELTQLQRFIDYGLITGIDSVSDVLPLEQSEGSRAPRNNQELIAQGYMLGNCSHCHNPRGEPSIDNPVLAPVLNFLPAPTSGIFQFPLEKYSPRIVRGVTGNTSIPYITPSLMDQPDHDVTNPSLIVEGPFEKNGNGTPTPTGDVFYGPWRSLIFRNVDTAFSYTDDYALFPHMPRNTPGYDPRAKQILSDWMVSIPAVRKHPELNEYTFCSSGTCDPQRPSDQGWVNGVPDESFQPYVEVMPGDPGYDAATSAAQTRLSILHTSINPLLPPSPQPDVFSPYNDPGDTGDIIDPDTIRDPICNPVPTGSPEPRHPQWVVTDLTQPATYAPRRSDWANILVEQQADTGNTAITCNGGTAADTAALADEEVAVSLLQDVTLSLDPTFRTFATTPVPFGLWEKKPGCNFASQPTVSSLSASPPQWLNYVDAAPTAPVYEETPGAAVFKSICINSHGPLADGTGRLAANLADMTGGLAVVADFRDGFMGPVGENFSNRHAAFGTAELPADANANWTGITDEDRAARYMPWMALGGTHVVIPQAILQIVSLTQVLGQQRPFLPANSISANMLSTAKAICLTVMNGLPQAAKAAPLDPTQGVYPNVNGNQSLIRVNGDAETWFNLCTKGHPAPVRVLQAFPQGGSGSCNSFAAGATVCEDSLYTADYQFYLGPTEFIDPSTYPSGAPVGNAAGGIDAGLVADNQWPWCVVLNGTLSASDAAAHNWPLCPGATSGITYWVTADANQWAIRGAINAGQAVFLYVEGLEAKSAPDPDYDQCELLGAAGDD